MAEKEFHPFGKVLVRDNNTQLWRVDFFSNCLTSASTGAPVFQCVGGRWNECVPYEGNERLVGTSRSQYKKESEFKWGEHVRVRDEIQDDWENAIFLREEEGRMPYYVLMRRTDSDDYFETRFQDCEHSDWA